MDVRENYKAGKLNGLCEEWYSNGQLEARGNYKDGKEDGLCEAWDYYGQLYWRANYKDGEKDGLYEEWDGNGRIKYRELYRKGELVDDLTDEVKFRNYLAKVKDIVDEWRESVKEKTKKMITLKTKKKGGIKL